MGKRSNGEGTKSKVTINGKKYYRIRITTGYNDLTGKQERKDFYGKTQGEAEDKAADYKKKHENLTKNEFDTLGPYFYNWLWNIKRPTVALTTFQKFEGIYRNHIKTYPPLNNMKLEDISRKKLQLIANDLIKKNSIPTVKYIYTLLSICFEYGLKNDEIKSNPCSLIDFPKQHKTETKVNYLNVEEQKALIKALEGDDMELPILIGLICGMRLGEILALTVQDINFDNKTIRVNKALKFVWTGDYDKKNKRIYEYTITPVKNDNSIRYVPFSTLLESKLKARMEQIKELKRQYKGIYEGNYLIADAVGSPVDVKKPNRHLHSILKREGLPEIHFHSLRHIFISNCIYADIPLKVIMDYVGHADSKMIMQIYSEIDKERNFQQYNKLNNLYD